MLAELEVPELTERLDRARADMDVQKITYHRLQQVWKSDPRLIARQDVDVANGKYQEAKAQLDELSALAAVHENYRAIRRRHHRAFRRSGCIDPRQRRQWRSECGARGRRESKRGC